MNSSIDNVQRDDTITSADFRLNIIDIQNDDAIK